MKPFQQSCNKFCLVNKEKMCLLLGIFHQLLPLLTLILSSTCSKSSIWFSRNNSYRGILSNLDQMCLQVNTYLLLWLMVVQFCLLHDFFYVPCFCKLSTFHYFSQLTWEMEHLYIDLFFPPLMWKPHIKVTNITKFVQMIFYAWFVYFFLAISSNFDLNSISLNASTLVYHSTRNH